MRWEPGELNGTVIVLVVVIVVASAQISSSGCDRSRESGKQGWEVKDGFRRFVDRCVSKGRQRVGITLLALSIWLSSSRGLNGNKCEARHIRNWGLFDLLSPHL